jgi:predicted glycosyltransferase/nucleoside-diphosphate-sugar epimerase
MVTTIRPVSNIGDGAVSVPRPGLAVVTGAAGFIGSTLCEGLLAAGWCVRGIDAFTSNYEPAQKRANLVRLLDHRDFELIEADLASDELAGLFDSADVVAHLAGEPGVSTSWGAGFACYVQRNVLATQRLLEAVATTGIRRLVYASSSSIYGSSLNGPVPETTIPHPASPYGVTKLAAEHLVGVYAGRGLPAVSLRYFSVYGPRQRPDMALHRFIEAALDLRPLTVFGDGTQARDFTYVDDVVAATMAALSVDLDPGTVLNVAGGWPVTVSDVVTMVKQLLGLDLVVVDHEPERSGDVSRTDASTFTAKSLLGWEPSTDFALGVAHQIDWHLSRRPRRNGKTTKLAAVAPLASQRGPRLLIYTQDGLGLGHLRRASSLASRFLKGTRGGSVLTVSDSPFGTMLRDVPNHDFLKLPSIVKAGPGDWHPLALPLPFHELQHLRSRLILETATVYQPDVLLVDHMPHGAMGELTPTLQALHGTSTRIILGLRDIIDQPEVVKRRWRDEGAFDALARYYDQVLVYGSRDVFDIAAECDWPAELAKLVRYCGYVCTPDRPDHPKRVRAKCLGPMPSGRLIVAMAGGGADGYPLMSTLLDALPEICATQPSVAVLVTGPFMPEAERQDLKGRAEKLPVRVRTVVRDPLSYVAAADLVVAMAGYNTTVELMSIGTRTLLVPRRGPSCEQRMRAQRFAERGWVNQLDPDELRADRLAVSVLAALASSAGVSSASSPDLNGLARATQHLQAAGLAARAPRTLSHGVPNPTHVAG